MKKSEKTHITNIDDGFDFLGWNFRKYSGKLLIKPSKKSVKSICKSIKETVKNCTSLTQDELISQLNEYFVQIGHIISHQRVIVFRSGESFVFAHESVSVG